MKKQISYIGNTNLERERERVRENFDETLMSFKYFALLLLSSTMEGLASKSAFIYRGPIADLMKVTLKPNPMGLRHVSRLTHFPGRHGKVREFSYEKIEKLGGGPLLSTLVF